MWLTPLIFNHAVNDFFLQRKTLRQRRATTSHQPPVTSHRAIPPVKLAAS
jgi:hypothetical protein